MDIFKVYKGQFWLLCLSSLLFFMGFSMIIPELPSYLDNMGGEAYKGWIIGVFAFMAALSRPVSGKLADRIGRVPVIMYGIFVCVICSALYPFVIGVTGFLILRMFHGMSTGFTPTGISSYVADIAPEHRRGEALGIQTLCANVGAAYGPALGSDLATNYSMDALFYAAAGVSILSLLLLLGLKETLPSTQKISWEVAIPNKDELIEKRVLMPSIIMVLAIFSFGLNLTVVPDFSEYLGMDNKGLFFTYLTLSSIFVRVLAGKASDRWGRPIVLIVACATLAISMWLIGMATSKTALLVGASVFGLAHGMASPTIFAWTIDLALPNKLGRAIATTFIALEVGVMSGAFIGGAIYQSNPAFFQRSFWTAGILALIAFFALIIYELLNRKRAT